MGAAIVTDRLTKWFGEGEARTYAVRDASFQANWGEILYIVGPSGSGKTTMLSMISGILRPNAGSVTIDGRDLWTLSDDQLADFRLNTIGFVFQDFHLFTRAHHGGKRRDSDGSAEETMEQGSRFGAPLPGHRRSRR